MTSEQRSFPERLTKIDALTRCDHHLLREEDKCFFLGEYTTRKGFSHSATNNLIINFKKPMDRRGSAQWAYKALNISNAARALYKALNGSDLSGMTFVPVPPSKAKSDPLYDDRMLSMLTQLSSLVKSSDGYDIDVRELVTQASSGPAAHDGEVRPSPAELAAGYSIENHLLPGVKAKVVICDDVLTTGSHFRAMCDVLEPVLAERTFRGLFLARRAPEAVDFSALFGDI
jgi:hypothetical protein